jgi:hypothetical protein
MAENEQNFVFPGITGFRLAVPPDRPDLLLLELETADSDKIRFSMTKESALSFGQGVARFVSG